MIPAQEAIVRVFRQRKGVSRVAPVHFYLNIERAGRRDRIGDGYHRLSAPLSRKGMFVQMTQRDPRNQERRTLWHDADGSNLDIRFGVRPAPQEVALGGGLQVLGLSPPYLLPGTFVARKQAVLAVRYGEERQSGRSPKGVGRDEANLEALSDGYDMLLPIVKREDVVRDMHAHGAAFVDFGYKQPVREDNSTRGAADRNGDRLAVAVQRYEALGRIAADGEGQAPKVARTDFRRSAVAERVQASIEVFGYIQRFVVGHCLPPKH